jgi:hypothetical protein
MPSAASVRLYLFLAFMTGAPLLALAYAAPVNAGAAAGSPFNEASYQSRQHARDIQVSRDRAVTGEITARLTRPASCPERGVCRVSVRLVQDRLARGGVSEDVYARRIVSVRGETYRVRLQFAQRDREARERPLLLRLRASVAGASVSARRATQEVNASVLLSRDGDRIRLVRPWTTSEGATLEVSAGEIARGRFVLAREIATFKTGAGTASHALEPELLKPIVVRSLGDDRVLVRFRWFALPVDAVVMGGFAGDEEVRRTDAIRVSWPPTYYGRVLHRRVDTMDIN